MFSKLYFLVILLVIFPLQLCQSQTDYMQQWPSFRGPYASGILDHADTPVTWNVEMGEK